MNFYNFVVFQFNFYLRKIIFTNYLEKLFFINLFTQEYFNLILSTKELILFYFFYKF